jgi:hypothetical protein
MDDEQRRVNEHDSVLNFCIKEVLYPSFIGTEDMVQVEAKLFHLTMYQTMVAMQVVSEAPHVQQIQSHTIVPGSLSGGSA